MSAINLRGILKWPNLSQTMLLRTHGDGRGHDVNAPGLPMTMMRQGARGLFPGRPEGGIPGGLGRHTTLIDTGFPFYRIAKYSVGLATAQLFNLACSISNLSLWSIVIKNRFIKKASKAAKRLLHIGLSRKSSISLSAILGNTRRLSPSRPVHHPNAHRVPCFKMWSPGILQKTGHPALAWRPPSN